MSTATTPTKSERASIGQLRIYQQALELEDQIYELAKVLPAERFYPLGNDLRRAAAAVAHYISESHRLYSYSQKIEMLHLARAEADKIIKLLERHAADGYGPTAKLVTDYTGVIKQSWGLVKWLRNKQAERQTAAQAQAKDELVAARS